MTDQKEAPCNDYMGDEEQYVPSHDSDFSGATYVILGIVAFGIVLVGVLSVLL